MARASFACRTENFGSRSPDALAAPRDETGKIDVAQTMQMVTSMIESWVREHPEQWMWLHKRWRVKD